MRGYGRRARVVGAGLIATAALLTVGVASAGASSASAGSETLFIVASGGENNAITLSSDGTTLTVTDTAGITANEGCTQQDPNTVTCPLKSSPEDPFPIQRFVVHLGDGVDSFTNVNFAADNSSISGFGEGSKTVNAGPGDQFVTGGSGDDTLRGDDGDDTLQDGSSGGVAASARGLIVVTPEDPTGGNDLLAGGGGRDETSYAREVDLTITLDGGANDGQPGESDNVQVEDVFTGEGDDIIVGDNAANALGGGGGDDRVVGRGGNDELSGDFGTIRFDLVRRAASRGGGVPLTSSGRGDDILEGGRGRDGFDCGRGVDVALRRPTDDVHVNCERIGAEIVDDNSRVKGASEGTKVDRRQRGRFKVRLECAPEEGAGCVGVLRIKSDGKKIGKGRFKIDAGDTKNGRAKLNKRGLRRLRQAGGSLLVSVTARTSEPGGFAKDRERIQLHG